MGCQQPTRYRVRETRVERAYGLFLGKPGLPVAVTPACAARGSNPIPPGKSRVHHLSCLQHMERIAGIEPALNAWKALVLSRWTISACTPQESNLHPLGFNQVLCLLS